jgi:signal transduction histidine kinase
MHTIATGATAPAILGERFVSENSSTFTGVGLPTLPSPTPVHRGDALLSATYRFFRCEDVDALAAAVLDTLESIFGAAKAAIVLTGPDGSLRLEATRGFTPADLERHSAAVRDVSPFVLLVGADDEVWSDDHRGEALHQQLATYESVASFSLPIVTEAGVAGNITAMFDAEQQLDEDVRAAARRLASQIGLALEVIDARTRLRTEAEQAQRERRETAEAVADLARQRDLLAASVEERTLHLTAAVEELQRASDAKTDFLANVSHELRTPLTSILGFVEILATGMDGPLNQAQADDVATIQTSSRHLLTLIDDLIDVATIEAGQVNLSLGVVAIDELVRESVETMRPLAGEKGISLEVETIEADLRATADRARLREIVLNLLSNALKFTPSKGRVRVSALTEAATDGRPATIRIDVRDSGIGVSDADRDKIFEKFAQTAGPNYPGTGLGLAISRQLARLHGGDLVVESTVGIGSTFSVHVPLAAAPAGGPARSESPG